MLGFCAGILVCIGMVPSAMATGTIVDAASSDDNFSALVDAVVAQDLAGALGDVHAQYTVFAPTNDAFAALPYDVKEALERDPSLLTDILLYHVVEHEYFADRVIAAHAFPTLQGGEVAVSLRDGAAYVDEAKIIATDIDVTNGVIHVIDTVLIPEGFIDTEGESEEKKSLESVDVIEDNPTIADLAIATPELSSLVAAVVSQNLVGALSDQSASLTVFAPTNDAFSAIPDFVQRAIERQPDLLTEILLYHVVGSEVLAADVVKLNSAQTLQGSDVTIAVEDGSVFVDSAQVTATDIQAVNGVVHLIDHVIVPESILRKAQDIDNTSLYRFWSDKYKSHFFTVSATERDFIVANNSDWEYEGFKNYTVTPGEEEAHEVYRFYSEEFRSHFYTISVNEKNHIIENDPNWVFEGVGYYAYAREQPGTKVVHRFWSDVFKSHFYTSSESESSSLQENDPNWQYEGVAWYIDESK